MVVREYINEKFTEESDPIYDIGIGIYVHRDFKSENESFGFIYDILKDMFNIKKTIDVIDYHGPHFIKSEYWIILYDYCVKYITINGKIYSVNPLNFKGYVEKRYKLEKNSK